MKAQSAKLTDADGQFGWRPSPVGLAITIGPSDQIETGRTIIRYLITIIKHSIFNHPCHDFDQGKKL